MDRVDGVIDIQYRRQHAKFRQKSSYAYATLNLPGMVVFRDSQLPPRFRQKYQPSKEQ